MADATAKVIDTKTTDLNVNNKNVTVKVEETKPYTGPELGSEHRIQAVHGRMIHPFTNVEFDADRSIKHVFDEWVKLQFDAEKLKLDD